jgi:ATP-binding cassette subfamily B protein
VQDVLRTAWPYVRRYRRGLAVGVVTILLMELVAISLPLLIRAGVDALMRGARLRVVLQIAGLMVLAAGVKGLLQYCSRTAFIGVSRDVEYDLRDDFFRHLIALSPDFYRRTRTGDLMSRAINDLNAVRMMVGPGLMNWLDSCFAFVPAVAVMASVDWQLTLVALLPAPFVTLSVIWFGRAIHERFERIQASFSDLSSRVQENISGVRVVRAYAQEDEEVAKFQRVDREYVRLNVRLARLTGMLTPLLQFLMGVTSLIVLWFGGYRLLEGRLSLGSYVMFNTYMAMLAKPMVAIGRVMNIMQRGTASLGRIQALLNERPTIAPPLIERTPASGAPLGEVRLTDVTIRFPSGTALDGVSLTVPAGTTTAIVGPTGSGKSTLVNLIPRLLDPESGKVRVDDMNARDRSPAELRRHIGVVPQETFLFSATLADNLTFGAEGVSDDQIRWAADVACLTSDIDGFPGGFQTVVGERGISLSGGQKQRTAIARAILRDPRILILDDALASVDTATEEKILTRLRDVMRGRTTILISHRASTARRADCIVVLEKGRITQRGTHAELLAEGGYYANCYREQLLEEALNAV